MECPNLPQPRSQVPEVVLQAPENVVDVPPHLGARAAAPQDDHVHAPQGPPGPTAARQTEMNVTLHLPELNMSMLKRKNASAPSEATAASTTAADTSLFGDADGGLDSLPPNGLDESEAEDDPQDAKRRRSQPLDVD